MRLLIAIIIALLFIGPAESVRVGGGAERVLLLGSMTQNASFQGNISGETNETNQSNISIQDRGMIDIKSSMSPVSVFNSSQVTKMPDSILANSISYQFTA